MFYDNGYVRLVDLSGDKNIYVNLYKRYKITLCKSIITKHKSLYSIERKISENGLYSFFYKNQKIKLTTLIKMVKFLKINMDLEKVVCEIGTKTGKSIINPNFPFNFNSSEGFRIISAIFGDGGISKKEIFSYYNYDLNLINGLIKSVIKVFGNVDYKFIQSGEGYQLNFPSIVAKILLCCGIKKGDKTINNPRIPEFIKEGNKKNKIVFLKQITDDDGSAQINAPYSYSVRYEFSINSSNKKESNIAKDLRYILVGLGYNTSKVYSSKEYKCKSKNLNGYSWAFDVQGKHTYEETSSAGVGSIGFGRL